MGVRSAVAEGPAVAVQVHVTVRGAGDPAEGQKDIPVRAVAVWYGKGKVEPRSIELATTRPATLALSPGRWVLMAEAAGYWGSEHPVAVTQTATEVTLDLWPAGQVEGGYTVPDGEAAPTNLFAFLRPAPEVAASQAPAPSKVVCPVERETWRCTLPAGLLDIRFQADGFIPRYQWGIRVPRGGALRLGRLDLRRGSAVLGWVVTADGTGVGDKGRVELQPKMGGPVRSQEDVSRLKALSFEAPIHPRGFFQLDGVPPGAYVLAAKHDRFATAATTVRVVPGEVTEIANPPLVLDLPQTLEVYLSPPLDPWGKPWAVRLLRLDRGSAVMTNVLLEPAESGGIWKKAGLAPASYLLKIGPHNGDTWQVEEVEVNASLAPLHLDINVLQVVGTLRLGKDPLAAKLTFGGRWGAVRIQARSDDEGKFQVFLPQAGDWSVHISSTEPPVNREIPKLAIQPKPDTNVAELAIDLPNTKLRGRVVDEAGTAVAGALVSVQSAGSVEEPRVQERADGEGQFEILGLPSGPVQVGADAAGDRSSDLIIATITDDQELPPVTLTLRPRLRISGTVAWPGGVVAGARVKAVPVGIPYFSVPSTTSDAQGRFEVTVPPATREMLLAVGAPGFAFRMLRIPVPEDRQFVVGVEQAGGTLIVKTEGPHNLPAPDIPDIFVLQGSAFEGLFYLRMWAVSSGANQEDPTRSVIPFVEPGEYRACWVSPAEQASLAIGIIPEGRCAKGFLPPNGELTLKLPTLQTAGSAR